MADEAKNTISELLLDPGDACSAYQDRTLRNPPANACMPTKWAFARTKPTHPKSHQQPA
jgi:hypothetical protein